MRAGIDAWARLLRNRWYLFPPKPKGVAMQKYKTHVTYDLPQRQRPPVEETLAKLIMATHDDKSGPVIIAIGGPGGTGKSTISKALLEQLPDATLLTLDDYKTPRAERQGKNLYGAHPD